MKTYITANYKMITGRGTSDKRIEKIILIFTVLIMVCSLIDIREMRLSSKERAAENLNIPESVAGEVCDMAVVREINSRMIPTSPAKCLNPPETDIFQYTVSPVPETEDSYVAEVLVDGEEPVVTVDLPVTAEEEPVVSTVVCGGFICDLSGMIIGCDSVSITDGVLRLPSDEFCIGVSAGAFASLDEEVFEIYIPANITRIEEGAFDGFTELLYVGVHPDNPVYTSSDGILLEK